MRRSRTGSTSSLCRGGCGRSSLDAASGWESCARSPLGCSPMLTPRRSPGAEPGLILFVQTFGDLVNFNPPVHVLAADGAFLADARFVALPAVPQTFLAEGFRRAMLAFLVKHGALSEDLRQRMLAWRHCSFSAHNEVRMAPEDAQGRKKLAGYRLRAPMSLEKMTYDAATAAASARRSSCPPASTCSRSPTTRRSPGCSRKGEIEAMISARAPSCFDRGAPKVGRLFPDFRAIEQNYFRRTGFFPIMRMIGIRKILAEQHSWLPVSVYNAFLAAKNIAVRELREVAVLMVTLPRGG